MTHLPRVDEGHAAENGFFPKERSAGLLCRSFENDRIMFGYTLNVLVYNVLLKIDHAGICPDEDE